MVKCENIKKGKLPLETHRKCINKYLREELKYIPESWPLFAIGREVEKVLAYLYPDRTIIGVPHPTGSFGYFNKIKNRDNLKDKLQTLEPGTLLWLG